MEFIESETIYKNYDCDLENVTQQLENFGVAVIPNILNEEEITNMRTGIWDTLEYLTVNFEKPIDRNNQETWNTWYELYPSHCMLLQTYSIGHSQFIWDIRQNPKVSNVFSKIWSCNPDELITSFDAVSFHIPPEITGKGWYKNNDWLHVDASYTRKEFECVQGFVTGYDINEGDGSLTFLEGSNNFHGEFADEFNIESENDWVMLDQDGLDFYQQKKCERHNIRAKAGSLILWDSRTVHCGMEPSETRLNPNFRLVTYVCMTPRSWQTEETLELRKEALSKLYMTSHCPHRPKLFPKKLYYNGQTIIQTEVPIIQKPNLTELGLKLSGY